MDRKIFFIDLDRTLLCDDKSISRRNKTALIRAAEEGHCITLSTGRAIASAMKIAKKLELPDGSCYIIAYNGGIVYYPKEKKVLSRCTLPREYARYVYRKAVSEGIYVQSYDDEKIIASRKGRELEYYSKRNLMEYVVASDEESMLTDKLPKLLLIDLDDHDRLEAFKDELGCWADGKCQMLFSDPNYLEVCPVEATKGAGLIFLEKHLHLPHEATVAVGDSENDISMIRAAHTGVAMKNAVPRVKEAADLITENDNDHDAIAEVIEKVTGIHVS